MPERREGGRTLTGWRTKGAPRVQGFVGSGSTGLRFGTQVARFRVTGFKGLRFKGLRV